MTDQPASYMDQFGRRLVEAGYPVIPIRPGTKMPGKMSGDQWVGYPKWQQHCERDTKPFEISIWRKWPGCAVGIACGKVIGVDIDVLDQQTADKVHQLATDHLGHSDAVRIGRAPKRLLVYRAGETIQSRKLTQLEILSKGRQFVAYGVHPDTQRPYEWPDDNLADIDIGQLPTVRQADVDAFLNAASGLVDTGSILFDSGHSDSQPASGDLVGTEEAIAEAVEWIPNDDFTHWEDWNTLGMAIWAGTQGSDAGLQIFDAWSAKSSKYDQKTTHSRWHHYAKSPPTRIGAGSIYQIAQDHGWQPSAGIHLNPAKKHAADNPVEHSLTDTTTAAAHAEPAASGNTADLTRPDGLLGRMVDEITASAISPQPFLAVGAALSAVGVLAGRRYQAPSGLRTNLYTIGIADSGGGKDHARKWVKEAFFAAGLHDYLGGNRIASGQAILSALYRHPAMLLQLDEFGHFLKTVLGPRAPAHKAEAWASLTELYTSADGWFMGTEYADQKENQRKDIAQPCLGVHATTVPGPLWKALENTSVLDGSLARWLIFRTDNDYPDARVDPQSLTIDEDTKAMMRQVAAGVGGEQGNLSGVMSPTVEPEPYTVPYGDGARDEVRRLKEAEREWLRGTGQRQQGASAVIARYAENTIKVALIHAISRRPADPAIAVQDLQWARRLVEYCITSLLDEASRHVADNETENQHKKVLEVIRKAGRKGLTKAELCRKTWFVNRRQREEIMNSLRESGSVLVAREQSKTKPVERYYFNAHAAANGDTEGDS
jgi:hypothetical protein